MVVGGVVLHQSLADFPREIQAGEPRILLLQLLDDAEAMAVVLEATVLAHEPVERLLARVSEGRMAEVVREGDGLGQVLVEPQRARDVPGDAGDFHRVREPGAEVVAGAVEEDLRLVFQPAKRA